MEIHRQGLLVDILFEFIPMIYLLRGKMEQLISICGHFYHFRGIILCNTKRLQFNQIKKKEHRGTIQQVFYSFMFSFFLIDEVVGYGHVAQMFYSLRRLHCHI